MKVYTSESYGFRDEDRFDFSWKLMDLTWVRVFVFGYAKKRGEIIKYLHGWRSIAHTQFFFSRNSYISLIFDYNRCIYFFFLILNYDISCGTSTFELINCCTFYFNFFSPINVKCEFRCLTSNPNSDWTLFLS